MVARGTQARNKAGVAEKVLMNQADAAAAATVSAKILSDLRSCFQ
jgi:hypothetical protein